MQLLRTSVTFTPAASTSWIILMVLLLASRFRLTLFLQPAMPHMSHVGVQVALSLPWAMH
jgi:hypothetical protein